MFFSGFSEIIQKLIMFIHVRNVKLRISSSQTGVLAVPRSLQTLNLIHRENGLRFLNMF